MADPAEAGGKPDGKAPPPRDPSKDGHAKQRTRAAEKKLTVMASSKPIPHAIGRVPLKTTHAGKEHVFADGPLGDPLHIPNIRTRGMPIMNLARTVVDWEEEWEKSFVRRNVTYVQGSVEFQSLIFATVLLEAALVVSSLVAGANDTFPETDKTIISEGVLYLLCLDFLMRVVGYGKRSFTQPRFYFDGFIVGLALVLTYLPVSTFDSIESEYGIKAASLAVSLRLGARVLRFALLLRILYKTAMDSYKQKPTASDLELEAKRLKQERLQRGKLPTPKVKLTAIVAFAVGYLWKFERRNMMRMIVEMFLVAGCSIAQPFLLSLIFDEYIPAKDYAKCTYCVVGVVAVMLLKAQMHYRLGNDNPSGGDFIPLMTKNLTRKAVRLPWTIFSSMHSDFLINALGTDLTDANLNLDLMVNGFAAGLDLIAVLLTMTLFSWQMSLLIATSLPLVVLYNKHKSAQVSLWAEKLNKTRKRSETHVQEIVHHVQHIKLLGIGPNMWRQLLQITDDLGEAFDTFDERKYGNIRGLAFLSMFTTLVTIAYGTVQVILGELTMGKLLGFLQLAQGIDSPIQALTVGLLGVTASRPAMAHIMGLLDAPEDAPGKKPPSGGTLSVKDVHFDYDYDNFAQSMGPYTFEVESGVSLAIVGASGCGKSTMLKLVAGLFKPKTGTVTYAGIDLHEYDTTNLISWMEQECVLHTGTLRENLVAGSKRAIAETELMRACDLARFDWGKLAEGMDTYLGQNGSNLSSGDRQRIAVARTILLRRPFIMCDEPTSAQDPATAGPVMASLLASEFDPAPGRPARKCTMLAVTHSISNAMRFDKVCVVSQGAVVEIGDTKRLLKLNGHFAQMVRNLTGITVLPSGIAMISAERLMDLWIFSRVRESQLLVEFTVIFISKQLRAGEQAAVGGTPADCAFIVARGALAVKDDLENILRTYEEGEMAGGINLHGKATRAWGFSLVALRPSVVLVLSKEALERELEKTEPAVRDAVRETQAAMTSAVHPTSLRRIWAFATVPATSLESLVARLEVGFYSEKKRLFMHPQDPPLDAMVVVNGEVSVRYKHSEYGEYVQNMGARSCFAESSAFSGGDKGTAFAGVAPRTNKGQSLTAITTMPTVVLIATRALLTAGGEHLQALAARAPKLVKLAADSEKNAPKPKESGWAAARRLTKLDKKGKPGFALAAISSMTRVQDRAIAALAEQEAHPRVFVQTLVRDVKNAATAKFLKKHWLLGALPVSLLTKIAKALVVVSVEEGQVLSGSYGWGSDATVVVSGEVRVTYPGVHGAKPRAVNLGAGEVVHFEALLNEARLFFGVGGTTDTGVVHTTDVGAVQQPQNVEVVSGGCVVLRLTRRAFLSVLQEASDEQRSAAVPNVVDATRENANKQSSKKSPSLTPSTSETEASVPKIPSTTSLVSEIGNKKKKLTVEIANAVDKARSIAHARDLLFTLGGVARVAPLEMAVATNESTKVALAEALVESASVRCVLPLESFAPGLPSGDTNSHNTNDTSTTSTMFSIAVLAGEVVVETKLGLVQSGDEENVSPAENAVADASGKNLTKEKRKPTKKKDLKSEREGSGGTLTKDLKSEHEGSRGTLNAAATDAKTYTQHDLFTFDSRTERLVVHSRAENENAVVCLFQTVSGDGRLEQAQRSLTAARSLADADAATRARRKQFVRQVKHKTSQAEIALGLRKNRNARANWRVSLQKLRVFRATCGDTENMVMSEGADSGACDLEEQLDMQNSVLAEVAASLKPREERLRALLERWALDFPVVFDSSMEPALDTEESDPVGPALGVGVGDVLEFGENQICDPENGDLSASRLDRLEDLIFARETHRLRRLRSYKVTVGRLLSEETVAEREESSEGLLASLRAIDLSVKELHHATEQRAAKQRAQQAIPRNLLEDNPALVKLFGIRIDAQNALARREEIERASRAQTAFAESAAAAKRARVALEVEVNAKENSLRELYVELEVEAGSSEDDLREDGGHLHVSRWGGRVERRGAALTAALAKFEKTAVLVRAAVHREREDRRIEYEAAEAAKASALAETEARLRAEIAKDLASARVLAMKNKAIGEKSVAFDEKTWSTAPFARKVMHKFRVTLAIKRQFESLVDDVSREIASEAIPEATTEMRREMREALQGLGGYESSDGAGSVASSAFGSSRDDSGDEGTSSHQTGAPSASVNPYMDFDDDDPDAAEPFQAAPSARSPVTRGATSIAARRASSRTGGLNLETPFVYAPVSPGQVQIAEAADPYSTVSDSDDAAA